MATPPRAFPTAALYEPIAGSTRGVWAVAVPGSPMVLKQLHAGRSGDPRWPTSDTPGDPYYWRREADLLGPDSALRDALSAVEGGIEPVACRGVFDRPDGSVALWLHRLTGAPGPEWPIERYGLAARQLGRTQAALTEHPVLSEPSLSVGWLEAHLELHRDLADPPAGGGARTSSDWTLRWAPALELGLFDETDLARTAAWWNSYDDRRARVAALQKTLTHFDIHPANLFDHTGPDGTQQSVVIDWAYAGVGPVGLDPACLALEAIYDFHLGPAALAELYRVTADGFVAGYQEAGGRLDQSALLSAMAETVVLKLGWTILATVDAVAEQAISLNGRLLLDAVPSWAAASRLLLDLADDPEKIS